MNRFTVEETNLLSIYHEGSKAQLDLQGLQRVKIT